MWPALVVVRVSECVRIFCLRVLRYVRPCIKTNRVVIESSVYVLNIP